MLEDKENPDFIGDKEILETYNYTNSQIMDAY
jgi:hypothetical protein